MSVNKVILIGRVGKSPEVRTLNGGNKVASFSLATDEGYKNKAGEKIEATEWHNVVVWGKLAEVVEKFVNKGDQIYVEGRLKTDTYEKDGVKHYSTKINMNVLEMLGSKPKEPIAPDQSYTSPDKNSGLPPTEYATQGQQPEEDPDVLPF